LSTAFYTQQQNLRLKQTPRKKDLIQSIRKLERKREVLKKEVRELRARLAKYEEEAAQDSGIIASYRSELKNVQLAAGVTPVEGAGLEITLGDNPQPVESDDPNNYIIHDYDLRLVVNTLWSAGAKAISINNRRLIATSSIRCAGNTILVNSTRLASPYLIKAVGDPDKLEKALEETKTTRQLLKEVSKTFGLLVRIEKKNKLKIGEYKGNLLIEKAKLVGED
jgi:uncharacterized protein YlxW (UPF0749 family)